MGWGVARGAVLTLGSVGRPNSKKLSVDPRVLGVKLRSIRSLEGGAGGGMSVARPAIRPAAWLQVGRFELVKSKIKARQQERDAH